MASRRSDDETVLAAVRLLTGVSVRAAEEAGGLSAVQLRALTVLNELDGPNLARLAEVMGVAVSTASRLVDRLAAAGWVARRPSAVTRRELVLELTARGRSTLARYDELRLAVLRERLDRLAPDRRAAVVAALADLVAEGGG